VGCVQACVSEWSLSTLLSPIPKLQHAPLPLKVLWARERALTPPSSIVFYLDSHLSPSKSWESVMWIGRVWINTSFLVVNKFPSSFFLFIYFHFPFYPFIRYNFSSIIIIHPCTRGRLFFHVTKYFVSCVNIIF